MTIMTLMMMMVMMMMMMMENEHGDDDDDDDDLGQKLTGNWYMYARKQRNNPL